MILGKYSLGRLHLNCHQIGRLEISQYNEYGVLGMLAACSPRLPSEILEKYVYYGFCWESCHTGECKVSRRIGATNISITKGSSQSQLDLMFEQALWVCVVDVKLNRPSKRRERPLFGVFSIIHSYTLTSFGTQFRVSNVWRNFET